MTKRSRCKQIIVKLEKSQKHGFAFKTYSFFLYKAKKDDGFISIEIVITFFYTIGRKFATEIRFIVLMWSINTSIFSRTAVLPKSKDHTFFVSIQLICNQSILC